MGTEIATTPSVVIRAISVSSMDNNVYLLTSRSSGRQILIDAADDAPAIAGLLAEAGMDGPAPGVELIITTHRHGDHLRALAPMVMATRALAVAGSADAESITEQTGVAIDKAVYHGEVIEVPGIRLDVIGLRGHTPGSIALAYAEDVQPVHLFTGDSLFPGGVGNTDRDPARFTSLLNDVIERVFAVYGDDARVHPGHGKPTTLGVERPLLEQWRVRGW